MVRLQDAKWLDYVRFFLSFGLLIFSGTVVCYSIVEQKTAFWQNIPGWAGLLIFCVALYLLGVMEGLQIALVELKRETPESYRESHPTAYRLGQLAGQQDNIEKFLMGRQVFVVCLVFFIAKLTTIQARENGLLLSEEGFLFYVPQWVQTAFLETGLLACIVVVILAQLMPQIVASLYPVQFLELLVMRPAYWACILLESTGLTHSCWVLAWLLARVFRMKEETPAGLAVSAKKSSGRDNKAVELE